MNNFFITSNGSVAAYTVPLTDDAEEAIEAASYDEDSNIFYGGVNFLLSF